MDFYKAISKRRSVYETTKESPIPQEEIEEIIKKIVDVAPSSFNSQSSRVVVLFGKKHEAFWKIVLKELKEAVSKEEYSEAKEKIQKLADSTGTILFRYALSALIPVPIAVPPMFRKHISSAAFSIRRMFR